MISRRNNRSSSSGNHTGADSAGAALTSAGETQPARRPPPGRSSSRRSKAQQEPAQELGSAEGKSQENRVQSVVPETESPSALVRSTLRRNEVSPEVRHQMIAEAAYLRAEVRGFLPGYDEDDWLAAEREVDAFLAASTRTPPQ